MIRLPEADSSGSSLLPDLTPLLDVIFIVLVFFLLTAQMPLKTLPLDLPKVPEDHPPAANAPDERLQIALNADGQWYLDDAPQSDFAALRVALDSRLTSTPPGIDLQLDRQAPLDAFLRLVSLLQDRGAHDTRILMEDGNHAP
ncbi:Biopolymer transport protein ExbD [Atopomonas hussainii]|uniref:Biopolymer transport protein ExbD n=1 Tax=Atopomonas hussainii TaxID=1429083 RepID=A0A1H7INE4_9GAMM|nr:biopolymer transporter ExbD [Atopomonas hussainii]SEK63824.1 Biopolymer transport protein ExbD [Atopomonas hussainii]